MPRSLKPHAQHIDTGLRRRLYIYFGISIVLIGVLIYNIVRGSLLLEYAIVGIFVGVIIGVVSSRMFHTSWNTDAKKVVSRLDIYGIGILMLYIVFEVFRERIVGYFTHGFEVGTIGFAVLAGVMFGRVLGTRGKIIKILKEQKIFL